MSGSLFERYAEHELKYQARKEISKQIRANCPEGDPMTTGVTVMIGTIIVMAVFASMMKGNGGGRMR